MNQDVIFLNDEEVKAINFMFDSMLDEDHSSRVRNVLFKEGKSKYYLIEEITFEDFSIAKMEIENYLVEEMLEGPLCGKALDDDDCFIGIAFDGFIGEILIDIGFDDYLCMEAPRRVISFKNKENVIFEATNEMKGGNLQQYRFLRSTMKPTPCIENKSDEGNLHSIGVYKVLEHAYNSRPLFFYEGYIQVAIVSKGSSLFLVKSTYFIIIQHQGFSLFGSLSCVIITPNLFQLRYILKQIVILFKRYSFFFKAYQSLLATFVIVHLIHFSY